MTVSALHRYLPALACAVAMTLLPPAAAHDHGMHDVHDPHLRAAPPEAPTIPSPVSIALGRDALAGLERRPVHTRVHAQALRCEGVALIDLLRARGAIPDGRLDGLHLSRYVRVDARDGYRVLFSLAELDPATGNRAAWLVDRCDGKALDDTDGPLRLLVPGDMRAARSVRQLASIHVVVAP